MESQRGGGGRPSVLGGEVGVVVIECKFKCNIQLDLLVSFQVLGGISQGFKYKQMMVSDDFRVRREESDCVFNTLAFNAQKYMCIQPFFICSQECHLQQPTLITPYMCVYVQNLYSIIVSDKYILFPVCSMYQNKILTRV